MWMKGIARSVKIRSSGSQRETTCGLLPLRPVGGVMQITLGMFRVDGEGVPGMEDVHRMRQTLRKDAKPT
jgi:hypothetical protein